MSIIQFKKPKLSNPIAKMYQKLKLTNASLAEIDAKVLQYAKTVQDFTLLALTERQKNDANFMLQLYKNNSAAMFYLPPNDSLQNNTDFMVKYLKIAYDLRIKIYLKNKIPYDFANFKPHIKDLILLYELPIFNASFNEKLFKEFADVNILGFISYSIPFDSAEEYEQIVYNIPHDILQAQAQKYGKNFVALFPCNHPLHTSLIRLASQKDGFDSLKYMKIEHVIENKDLVVKSYEMSNLEQLNDYINNTLSPRRKTYFMCNGQRLSETYYDRQYAQVQEALKQDEEIKAILNNASENS